MRNLIAVSFVLCAALATTGCSAVGSAVGGALSPKPPQVTVVNNVEAHPAPQTVVVKEAKPKRGRSLMEKVGIVTTSTVVGAGVGALLGDALDSDTAGTTLLGAGLGAAAGVLIVKDK